MKIRLTEDIHYIKGRESIRIPAGTIGEVIQTDHDMVRCEFDGHDTPKWIYPQEREKVNETHDWETKSIDVRHLNGTHILVGESGGLSAVYNHAQSVGSSEMWAVETEHGTLVFAAQQVDILDLDSDQ